MGKFKKMLAGMLTGASALACVAMVGNVNAAAGDIVTQNFVDTGWDSESTSTTKDGWSLENTSGISKFTVDAVEYSITKISAKSGKITSPKLADNAIASTADISVTVGTTATSTATPFTVNALSSGAVVATGSMYTPASKALASATTTSGGSVTVLTLSATSFDSIQVVAGEKNINVSKITVSYTLTELSNEEIEAGKIQLAEEAIAAIGTVSYSTASADKIAAAKTAIDAVTSTSSISNYSVYTAAVETYNTLKTTAISSFKSAVSALSVNTLTKLDIDDCFAEYDSILADDRTEVADEYNSLIGYSDQYINANVSELDLSFNSGDLVTGTTYGYRQLGNSIFTAISQSTTDVLTVGDHAKKLDGVDYTKRIYTNSASTISSTSLIRAIRVNAPSAGTLKLVALGQNNSDTTRKIELYNSTFSKIASEGVNVDGTTSGCTVEFNIGAAGVYYLGVTNGVSFYNFEFEVAKLNAQFDNDTEKTEVRFIGTIKAEDLSEVTDIKITLTLSGFETPAVVEFTTVYTSITDLDGFGEAENTYYVVLVIDGLAAFRTSTLNATLSFKIAGVEYSASLASALSLAIE